MEARLGRAALIGLALVAAAPVSAAARAPTAKQIKAAVGHARRSKNLWATVNICDTRKHPNVLGIRGQMPALGFAANLSLSVAVDYWSTRDKRFEPVPGLSQRVPLGTFTTGVHQGGATFSFKPPAKLNGTVTFEWRRGGKLLGRAHESTVGGEKRVDGGDPPRHSAATCRIS
jgi:hypothetical protein